MDRIISLVRSLERELQEQRNVPDPQHGVTRRGYLTPEEAYDTCRVCGPIIPRYVTLTGRWLKGTCTCFEVRYRERQELQERLEFVAAQVRENYEWLGKQWSDIDLTQWTFENFDTTLQPGAVETVRFFLADMHGSLVLHSMGFGTGKTHILASIVNLLRESGKASRFTTAPKLFRAIQERMDHHEEYMPLLHKATHTPLLVLDDVDKAKPSEWKQELYFEIVDERVKRGLPIALSTNRVSDLAFYVGGAACSRLSISQIDVDMNGADYRMRL